MGADRKKTMTFGAYCDAQGLSLAEVCDGLGLPHTSRPYVSRLQRGERKPSLELAHKIEEWSRGKVPARSWFAPDAAHA